jgi:hypothetical protein
LETVFATLAQLRAGGLVIPINAFLASRSRQLAELALRHAMPAISGRGFAAAGGLMDYGPSDDQLRQIGVYVGRILKGENPADLPVQEATTLVVSSRTETCPPMRPVRSDPAGAFCGSRQLPSNNVNLIRLR